MAKEKAHTRAGDALAAERRRLPMTPFPTDFSFEGPDGELSFLDLFEGRPQLLLYHFWFPEDGEPCGGCTMFTDQVPPLEHLNARDVTFAVVSRAPQDRIAAYKERMGWSFPWYTDTLGLPGGLRHDRVLQLQCFLRYDDDVYLTYETTSRGVEAPGQRLDLPRPDAVRPPGGLGGLAARPPAGAAVPVVAQEGRVLGPRSASGLRPRHAASA